MVDAEMDGGVVGWVVALMDALGAPGIGLAIALENVFPPLPSEVFLPLAGFAAARGELGLVAAITWTTLGSLVGALALYGVGAALGRDRMRALADRMPLVNVRDVEKAEAWFARHGAKAVFLGRMVPLVRSLISVPAGVERMRLPLFAALTAAGSLLWNTAFVLAGYLLGANWGVVEQYADGASKVVVGLLAVAVVVFVVRRVVARRRAGRARLGSVDVGGARVPGVDDPTVRFAVHRPGPDARKATFPASDASKVAFLAFGPDARHAPGGGRPPGRQP